MKNVEKHLLLKIEQALQSNLSQNDILQVAHISANKINKHWLLEKRPFIFCLFTFCLGCFIYVSHQNVIGRSVEHKCILSHTPFSLSVLRPISTCSFCSTIEKVAIFRNDVNVTQLKEYAFRGHPFVLRNIAKDWPALKYLSIRYLRMLFDTQYFYKENARLGCQFFSYKTKFKHLRHVFYWIKKSKEKLEGQFYIGWSNCVSNVSGVLRKQYKQLPFMTDDIRLSKVDWIFIGGGGNAADMHIDTVGTLSWQAVLKGRKTWHLEPPPECESICKRHLSVTLDAGDAIVVDTNVWFHSTYIHPSHGVSIAIGSEFT